MGTSTALEWCALFLFSLVHYSMTSSMYGEFTISGPNTINTKHIEVKSNGYREQDGKCRYTAVGRGVKDTLVEECAANIRDFTQINIENYYTYFYPDYQPFGLYSDTWGTLVTIKPGGCTLRTYQTSGQANPTVSTLSSQVCDSIKKRIDDEMVRVTEYWEKWEINFERKMQKLPPAEVIFDPLKNQPRTPSLYSGPPGATVTASSNGYNAGLSLQPLTPNLPSQPLTSSLPAQHIASPTAVVPQGRRTILGEDSIEINGVSSINNPFVIVNDNTFNNNDGCVLQYVLKGNGVYDSFKMPCPQIKANKVSMNGFFILGHPDMDAFSIFTDEPSTLYLMENGLCTKKTYTISGGVISGRVQFLSNNDCDTVKQRLKKTLKNNGMRFTKDGTINFGDSSGEEDKPASPLTPTLPSQPLTPSLPLQPQTPSLQPQPFILTSESDEVGINCKKIKVTTGFLPKSSGQCEVVISVEGRGVQDKFTEPCSDKAVDSVSTEDVFVFGDPAKDSLSLYSNEANTLYVIQKKVCAKKTYETVNGMTTSKRTPMRLIKCNELKKTIPDTLRRLKSKTSPTAVQQPVYQPPVVSPSFSPSPSSGTSVAAVLKQFEPTYPLKLGNNGINSQYDMSAVQIINSYNVKGCNFYIKAKGKGINDHFQVACSNECNKALSTKDFMLFGSPTSTLGLFSDTPSTLVVMNKGTCYKKTYGSTARAPALMAAAECDAAKKRMLDWMNLNKNNNDASTTSGGLSFDFASDRVNQDADSTNFNPSGDLTMGNFQASTSPQFDQSTFNPFPGNSLGQFNPFAGSNAGQFNPFNGMTNGNPQPLVSPGPVVTSNGPTTAGTTSTITGVSWREGIYGDIYNGEFIVNINNIGGGQCSIEVVGRGVNELITDYCSVLGDNIKTSGRSYVLAVADPTKQSGLYTEDWGELVFVREGLCYKKKYDTEWGQHTKIRTNPMSPQQCKKVKDNISSTMGVTFGQAQGSLSPDTPMWRAGNYGLIYNGSPTVTVTKKENDPRGCIMVVTIIGRAINDQVEESCSVMGTNILKKVTTVSVAVADPSSNSGFYSEDWGSMVVIKNGVCTYRTYDSSPITNNTKITPKPMGKAQCDKVKEKISGTLGVNFGY